MTGADKWQCPKCKKGVDCRNSWRLETAPNTLIISLKRFDPFTLKKISRHVAFPVHLDLSEHMVRRRVILPC